MKKLLKKVYCGVSKAFLSIFYDKKYLSGKYFKNRCIVGYKWAWKCLWQQKILGRNNKGVPWPCSQNITITRWQQLEIDPDDINNFLTYGCYFQTGKKAKIIIGKGTWIAPNVGIITTNHDVDNLENHVEGKDVIIGKNCWIGMNSVVLPGVTLGDKTIVGAGSIVTKSFEGNCVIAGNPAKKIKELKS